ncbi:MAG: terminase large subunit [Acidobacteriota bacterium]
MDHRRKCGKSTLAADIGLNLFCADGEPGAEVYTAATKRDQARITRSEAARMVTASPSLRRHIGIFRDNLHVLSTSSKFEPLGADADFMDGLNVHGAIVDELHAHRNREVWDVLETATGSRRQPLLFAITTAGFDRHSICWELHEYMQKVLEGLLDDDSLLGYIACLDEGDDWTDETAGAKANPSFGVCVKLEDLRRTPTKELEKLMLGERSPTESNRYCDRWGRSVGHGNWAGDGGDGARAVGV